MDLATANRECGYIRMVSKVKYRIDENKPFPVPLMGDLEVIFKSLLNMGYSSFYDVGCASGYVCEIAHNAGFSEVGGIDINPVAVQEGYALRPYANMVIGSWSVALRVKPGTVIYYYQPFVSDSGMSNALNSWALRQPGTAVIPIHQKVTAEIIIDRPIEVYKSKL